MREHDNTNINIVWRKDLIGVTDVFFFFFTDDYSTVINSSKLARLAQLRLELDTEEGSHRVPTSAKKPYEATSTTTPVLTNP